MFKMLVLPKKCITPILHTWFWDCCLTFDGSSVMRIFPCFLTYSRYADIQRGVGCWICNSKYSIQRWDVFCAIQAGTSAISTGHGRFRAYIRSVIYQQQLELPQLTTQKLLIDMRYGPSITNHPLGTLLQLNWAGHRFRPVLYGL
jgi:hypothetical protein